MSELHIPIDPLNPGQFFACCGLLELTAFHCDGVLAHFEADEATPRRASFVLDSDTPLELPKLLRGLRDSEITLVEGQEESTRPVTLHLSGRAMTLDWWLDEFRTDTTNLKCWAGQVTTRKLLGDLLALVKPDTDPCKFFVTAELSKSKFGVDPRSAWNALDFGFSPDAHNRDASTYPMVEVLAAIGLQGFRPDARRRHRIEYYLWTSPLPVEVARLAAVAAWEGLPRFEYEFSIAKRGQSYKFFTFAEYIERKAYYQ